MISNQIEYITCINKLSKYLMILSEVVQRYNDVNGLVDTAFVQKVVVIICI